ncbi:MAG: hypothetical protein JXA28_05795, partial [Bacteroidetes bacterium]|nr:hypothetical protein [Bacteroidota bacterium]
MNSMRSFKGILLLCVLLALSFTSLHAEGEHGESSGHEATFGRDARSGETHAADQGHGAGHGDGH